MECSTDPGPTPSGVPGLSELTRLTFARAKPFPGRQKLRLQPIFQAEAQRPQADRNRAVRVMPIRPSCAPLPRVTRKALGIPVWPDAWV